VRGEIPIYEPGLEELVAKNVRAGRLSFTTELAPAIRDARAVFIAVGTPPLPDGRADLSFVRQVAEAIGDNLNDYKVIVTKSTVPVGTGQMVEQIVGERSGGGQEFAVVSNPEFLREGSAIEDFLHPDRVVVGARTRRALDVMTDIYAPLKAAGVPFVLANVESAEMIKYASNGFLATKISFINEVAEICEAVGADVEVVARGMGLDHRIGPKFLHPGPGFGGSCFPKDTRAVAQIAEEHGLRFEIIDAVLSANDRVRDRMVPKIDRAFGGVAGRTIAFLGLAFKGDTDDMRESPAMPILAALAAAGAKLRAFDPAAMNQARPMLPAGVELCPDAYSAAEGADGVVIATEWNQFRALELGRLKKLLGQPLIVDLRNLYEPERVAAAGFRYVSIGRPEAAPETAS
ncbi:MAG TPA: UDP-glucose/GDP-mannose dehydrogenase family protein, partial [Thermoanaerobaculia bacterium]|nr:UDP-glucose/GDP-mannose dehydrogenase family protein [Thermoanaerobaculia bacterium]